MSKQNKRFEKWAIVKLKKIQKILLLEDFHPLEVEPGETETSESVHHYPYKKITIRYSKHLLEDFKKKKYEKVISILTHEMCHPITDGLYSKAVSVFRTKDEVEDERERLTDAIANIVIKNVKI